MFYHQGMKLSEWARREGMDYMAAWRWWRARKLPVPARQTATGTILVEAVTCAKQPTRPDSTGSKDG